MDNDWNRLMETYPPKRGWDHTYPWIAYVLRPSSFPVSWLLHKLGATANQVTLFTGLLLAGAFFLLAGGRPDLMLWGSVLVMAYNWVDCMDGNLARAWPAAGPPVGKYWDQLVGSAYYLTYFFIGVGLGDRTSLLLGAGASIGKCMTFSTRMLFWSVLGDAWRSQKNETPARQQPARVGRWYYKLYYNVTDLQAHVFLVPLVLATHTAPVFLRLSLLAVLGETAFLLAMHVRRSARMRGTNRHAENRA